MRRFISDAITNRPARSSWLISLPVETLEPRKYLSASFAQPVTLGGNTASSFVVADMNGDSKPDIVSAVGNGTEGIDVYVNKGNGTFDAPIMLPYSSPGTLDSVVVGDFNGDGVPDIAVANQASGTVECFLGAGTNVNGTNPTFLAPISSTFTGVSEIKEMQLAHFGGRFDDLVISDGGSMMALLSSGDGHFTTSSANVVTAIVPPYTAPQPVGGATFVVADFNGDGVSDIAYESGAGVSVQFGASGGSFLTTAYHYSVPDGAEGLLAAPLASPSPLPDLICNSGVLGGGDVSVLLNNGGGSFGTATAYPVTDSTFDGVGDFQGNGAIDISVGTEMLFNTGAGTFSPAVDVGAPPGGEAGAQEARVGADLNGDGYADLVEDGDSIQLNDTANGGGGGSTGGGGGTTNASSLIPTLAHSTLPASVVAGGTGRGEAVVDVTNSGSTTYDGTATVAVDASGGTTTPIGTIARRLVLRSGATAAVVVPIRSLPATLNGNYTLLATVTDASGNTSTSGAGPALTAAAPFVSFSDTIIGTTLAPADVSGQKTRADAEIKITNNGNIVSTGESAVAFYASVDTTPTDGTLIRSVNEQIALKPGASRVIRVPLLSLPDVANNAYFIDARITDPKGDITTAASSAVYALAAPFLSLVPSAASVAVAKDGSAIVTFSVTDNGNIAATGISGVSVAPSTAPAAPAFTQRLVLPLQPGKARTVRVRLTTAEVATLQAAATAVLQLTDPLGGIETTTLTI